MKPTNSEGVKHVYAPIVVLTPWLKTAKPLLFGKAESCRLLVQNFPLSKHPYRIQRLSLPPKLSPNTSRNVI
jgi:hypothetical protein